MYPAVEVAKRNATNIENACNCRALGLSLVVTKPDNKIPAINDVVSYFAM